MGKSLEMCIVKKYYAGTSKQVTYSSEEERALQIFFASLSGISVCRGTASI
jgi:hypothetical protein